MSISNKLVSDFVNNLQWEMLDADVQHKVKICLLDVMGAILAGTVTEVHRITANYAANYHKGDESTIFMTGGKLATAAGAAFANSYTANAFDIDDTGNGTQGHPGAQLAPVALAVTEKTGKSGTDMLTAMVIGYEVAFRVSQCWHDHHQIYQSCGSWCSVANASVASKLMGLNVNEIQHALGIAEYFSPNTPMLRDLDDPAMVKSGSGWGALTGVTATELALAGFSGIPNIMGFEKYQSLIVDIGEKYYMRDELWFKEFACCGFSHAGILAVLQLREKYEIQPEKIDQIVVEGDHYMVQLGTKIPETTEEAQFNTAWPIAVCICDGEVGPQQMRGERLQDKQVRDLVRKIELVESKVCSNNIDARLAGTGGKSTARVKITLVDGNVIDSGFVDGFDGLNYGIQTEDSWFENKFRQLLREIVPQERVERIIDMVWRFDKLQDVSEFISLIK